MTTSKKRGRPVAPVHRTYAERIAAAVGCDATLASEIEEIIRATFSTLDHFTEAGLAREARGVKAEMDSAPALVAELRALRAGIRRTGRNRET